LTKTELELEISNSDRKLINAIYEALNPDNIDFPEGLRISLEKSEDKLIVKIESSRKIETLISTVDEILENIQSLVDTLKGVVKF
jgi:hypothetical protein